MNAITDTEALAREIFMADNSNAPDPAAEWGRAGPYDRAYARHIALALAPIVVASNQEAYDAGYHQAKEDGDLYDIHATRATPSS